MKFKRFPTILRFSILTFLTRSIRNITSNAKKNSRKKKKLLLQKLHG